MRHKASWQWLPHMALDRLKAALAASLVSALTILAVSSMGLYLLAFPSGGPIEAYLLSPSYSFLKGRETRARADMIMAVSPPSSLFLPPSLPSPPSFLPSFSSPMLPPFPPFLLLPHGVTGASLFRAPTWRAALPHPLL